MHFPLKRNHVIIASVAVLAVVAGIWTINTTNDKVDFSTEVKPIINKHCITCHGGVKAKAGFSLLFRDQALAKTKSGKPAIIPGDPDLSELMRRITLNDPEDRMPYKHDPLSKKEIDVFRKWIKEGAPWGDNWSYVALKPVEVPQPKTFFGLISTKSDWAKNEVDNFIEQKQTELDLPHAAQADKATLLRRVGLDIIGMPAPESLAKKFMADNSDKAYENLVDSLLASPRYGEKWASMWLDLARYADTKGYEADYERNIWRYRDWVINAFYADMPYDSFLIKQIAGDLLPDPTDNDYIATAFNRNTMTNDEGGTDNEEFRTSAVMDRVNTTWTAVMGTTFGCVQCHSHPYDPFKHEDYYKFLAFYNNSRDEDTQADYPLLRQYNSDDSVKMLKLITWLSKNVSKEKAKEYYTFLKTWQPTINSLQCDQYKNAALVSSWYAGMRNNGSCRLQHVELGGNQLMFRYLGNTKGGTWTIHTDSLNGPVLKSMVLDTSGAEWKIAQTEIPVLNGYHDLYFTYKNPNLKTPEETGVLFEWFCFKDAFPGKDVAGYNSAYHQFWQLMNAKVNTTPVMYENPDFMHRTSYIFERGNWMVKGDKVEPAVPASLNLFPANAPKNRLGLAEWIVSKQNPLTARTITNRVWEQLFGKGLSEILEDLGTQGVAPTHPELLDWLSYNFMNDYHWSMKTLIKEIVMSATYQQSSKFFAKTADKDPQNIFYTRGPRVRLSAEQVRDQALCMAGVMSNKMYGPGVMPYQPDGIWLSPWNGSSWVQSKGEDQYRRAVYTYWKRSAAYPSMLTFDGVSREVCTARRIRTNTPLQALTTLNDSAYIDCARNFALRMQREAGDNVKQQIVKGYKIATFREIDNKSLEALEQLYDKAYAQFKNDEAKTCEIMGGMDKNTNAQNAALSVVANAILNLDEVVTKN